jgi:hypothetical protein
VGHRVCCLHLSLAAELGEHGILTFELLFPGDIAEIETFGKTGVSPPSESRSGHHVDLPMYLRPATSPRPRPESLALEGCLWCGASLRVTRRLSQRESKRRYTLETNLRALEAVIMRDW